jgi:alkylation response protein AidB-like acyl-CoA dehydrogenase
MMHAVPVPMSLEGLLKRGAEIAQFCAENAAEVDQNGSFPEKEFSKIAGQGLLAAPLGRSLGGLGLGFESQSIKQLLQLLRLLGKGNLSVGRIYEGHVNGLQLIQTFGYPEQLESFARDTRAQKIFGVWNAEAVDGLKIFPLDHKKYELSGSKTFCSGAGKVQRPLVGGILPDGKVQLCVVPMEQVKTRIDPSWWTATGMRGSVSAKIDFSGVVLDENYLRKREIPFFALRAASATLRARVRGRWIYRRADSDAGRSVPSIAVGRSLSCRSATGADTLR